MKKIIGFSFMILLIIGLVSCKDTTSDPVTYTVTFDSNGGSEVSSQEVTNGGKVVKPEDPTKDGYAFSGSWYNGTFEWNFDIDIVTEDVTLTASWILVSTTPQNIVLTSAPFSSDITWIQSDAELQTFNVSIEADGTQTFTDLPGTFTIDQGEVIDTVTFTPDQLPLGGAYVVKIDTGVEFALSESLVFGGAGTEGNPYIVNDANDVLAVLDDSGFADKYFKQVADVLTTLTDPIEINDDRKVSFSGQYDGQGFALSFTGNGALFHEITESGVVKNLVIDSTTQLSASETNIYAIGVIADTNAGLIQNVESRAQVVDAHLQGNLSVFTTVDTTDHSTGAGGIVGINQAEGSILDVTIGGSGAVKAGRGIGGVAAYNFGLISGANVSATLPAGNQANSGKSSNTYSYGGGVAGFNFGTITESVVTGRVFAQSAYSATGDGNEGKNVAFGGIAGYNEGTISDSSFARTMSSKEFIDKSQAEALADSANNLGVASIHGDLYIGGIAGINAGTITDAYVGGALIAARDYVGGVTGLTLGSGSIQNTYVFAEVDIKDDGGLKVTEANSKTTLTSYEIAPSGFDANTVIYRALLNSNTQNTWAPGDQEQPMLPEFTATDLTKVGNHFAGNGLLNWQNGVVTSVDIALDSIVLAFGATETLDYTITPNSAPDSFTTWTSSDDSIVEIISEGVIKGVGAGEATVTVTTRDGGYTDTITVTVEDYIKVETATVSATIDDQAYVLPEANNADVRVDIAIDTVMVFTVDFLPTDAQYQNFTLTASNSRATVDGNTVTFVYGSTGPGKVSIVVSFEDSTVASLEYRFTTFEETTPADISITSVVVTAGDFTLPEANNVDDRLVVVIGTEVTFLIDIQPTDATVQTYTITSSNSRATVDGNTVTFLYGNTGPGSVSIVITFDDPTQPSLEYRFTTTESAS